MNPEEKLVELGLELPPPPAEMGVYRMLVQAGGLAYLSGHAPLQSDGTLLTGRLGEDLSLEEGQHAARLVGLALLATLRHRAGSLNRVKRIVKSLGFVNCTPDFTQQPQVINGFSELMRDVFGPERGVGARSAVGTNALPGHIPVEIELIVELAD